MLATNLFHDAGLALGKSNVATRLVRDELDLNLAALAATLFVVIIIVVGRRRTLAFDAARLGGAAVAYRVGVVNVLRRRLVVLVGDVGHGCGRLRVLGGWIGKEGEIKYSKRDAEFNQEAVVSR